jgi:hypothetical protein
MIRKGQACWNAAEAKVGLLHRFILALFAAMFQDVIQVWHRPVPTAFVQSALQL